MIEVELSRVVVDEEKNEQFIVLKGKNDMRILPIVIGSSEADAIRTHLSGFVPPRPMTHDLIVSLLSASGTVLEKVIIDKIEDNTFHAKLYLTTGREEKIVDARPSDSLALSIRTGSPVFVEEAVFEALEEE